MKTITLGLALSLLGGVALAQTPPSPPPILKQPAAGPASQPTPGVPPAPAPQAPVPPQSAQGGAPGQDPMAAPNGPPEGMIVETPNGFYLVHPGDAAPRRLDMGKDMNPGGTAPGGMAQNGPAGPPEGEEPMDDMEDGSMRPQPRHGHPPMPPHPPEGKGARFRIRTPNLTLGMKCPDDEPVKACIDAVSQLLDKASPQAH